MIRSRLFGVLLAAFVVVPLAAGCSGEARQPATPPSVQQSTPPEVDGCDDLDDLIEGDADCYGPAAKPTRTTVKPTKTTTRNKPTKATKRSSR